jgi:branched-chain amino acid transport system permease protein
MLQIRKLPVAVFALFIVIFPWVAYRIPAIKNYTGIMVFVGIYCLITIGLSLLMGYAGQISLGQAAFYGIGAYTTALLTTRFGVNPWICMLVGMAAAAGVALLLGAPSLKLRGHYLAMATLAFGVIVFIVFNEETRVTGGPDGLASPGGPDGLASPGGPDGLASPGAAGAPSALSGAFLTKKTTRRFLDRLSGVSLGAAGRNSP